MNRKQHIDKHFYKKPFVISLITFFVMSLNLTIAQEFKIDSLLLERKTFVKDSNGDISVIKKVFATTKRESYSSASIGVEYEGYSIKSEYWLFWNNQTDSLQISILNPIVNTNFKIYTRHIQNKINAVVLEFSEILDSRPMNESRNRVFRVINLDTKGNLLSSTEQEILTMPNGGAHGDYRHDIDTYIQEYSLTFDDNDNITVTHTKSIIVRGMGKREEKKTMPKRFYRLTTTDGRLHYLRKYDN